MFARLSADSAAVCSGVLYTSYRASLYAHFQSHFPLLHALTEMDQLQSGALLPLTLTPCPYCGAPARRLTTVPEHR